MNNYQNLQSETGNPFYERINSYIKSKSEQTIIDILNSIKTSNEDLTVTQLKVLGGLSYLLGLDFISQTEPNSLVLNNVNNRLAASNINKTIYNELIQTLHIVTENRLEKAVDEIKNKINTNLETADNIDLYVNYIQSISKDLFVPVSLCLDVQPLTNKNVITYHQLLMFNSLVYEKTDIDGSLVVNKLLPLLRKPSYGTNIQLASEYFEQQKYGIIYLDSIVSASEFIKSKPESVNWVLNEELLNELNSKVNEEPKNISEVIREEVEEFISDEKLVERFPYEFAGPDSTDQFVAGLLNAQLFNNFNNDTIKTPQDIFTALEHLVVNEEETLGNLYMFMKKNQEVNRMTFEDVYPTMNLIAFNNELDEKLNELKDSYRNCVEMYISPMPTIVQTKVVQLINNLIKNVLFTVDAESKAYLIQQLNENQIETYKHLHQVIELVENCTIKGSNIKYYKEFYDFIKSDPIIIKAFEDSQYIETAKNKMSAFAGLHDFYNRPSKEESLLTIKNK